MSGLVGKLLRVSGAVALFALVYVVKLRIESDLSALRIAMAVLALCCAALAVAWPQAGSPAVAGLIAVAMAAAIAGEAVERFSFFSSSSHSHLVR